MNKKIIIVGVVILALSMLFVACKNPEETQPTTTTTTEALEITTAIDDNGAYVFNKDGEKVYLKDEQGFVRTPELAYNAEPENGFFVNENETEKDASIDFSDILNA